MARSADLHLREPGTLHAGACECAKLTGIPDIRAQRAAGQDIQRPLQVAQAGFRALGQAQHARVRLARHGAGMDQAFKLERLPRQLTRLATQLRQAPSFPGIKQQEGAQEHRAAHQESAHR